MQNNLVLSLYHAVLLGILFLSCFISTSESKLGRLNFISNSYLTHSKIVPFFELKASKNPITPDKSAESRLHLLSVKIAADRMVFPGDYVIHEQYGIGRYIGSRNVSISPMDSASKKYNSLVVQFSDGFIHWYEKMAKNELYVYRDGDSICELSSIMDPKKWNRKRNSAERKNKKLAVSLIKMMAVRNGIHRLPCSLDGSKYKSFEDNFPFKPTDDQIKCFNDVANDMIQNTRPMDRLICGDVGFGKTEVAIRAIYRAVLSNKQVAVLAPTRVLAMQHERTIRRRMPDITVRLLRGGGKGDASRVKAESYNGSCQVLVGTHAILQSSVQFNNLGLVIIDEEQRFGVQQKEKLKSMASGTDILTLSATPIPRTLQMSLSGLRDLSILNSPPIGRKEVVVKVNVTDETMIKMGITREIERGGQVFVVVPYIEYMNDVKNLLFKLLPNIRILELHGRMENIEERIDSFLRNEADVLLATTVVENGIDMPNVNTLIVMYAERFGMSTLYQLRGRVGRSDRQAYAFFMKNTTASTQESEQRLSYIEAFTALGSGFDLARKDMEIRGAGAVFGEQQSGSFDLGIDLQAKSLSGAIAKIQQEILLPVPDVRMRIFDSVEAASDKSDLQQFSGSMVNEIARFEVSIAKTVIERVVKDIGAAPASVVTKVVREMTKEFVLLSTVSSVDSLEELWAKKYFHNQIPAAISDLLFRSKLRILCRKLGINEVNRNEDVEEGIRMHFADLPLTKWKLVSKAIPKIILDCIVYKENQEAKGSKTSSKSSTVLSSSVNSGSITYLHAKSSEQSKTDLQGWKLFLEKLNNCADQLLIEHTKEFEDEE